MIQMKVPSLSTKRKKKNDCSSLQQLVDPHEAFALKSLRLLCTNIEQYMMTTENNIS